MRRSWRRALRRLRPSPSNWPDGSRAALSLSFDDARASQVSGREILDRLDVEASFFVLPKAVRRDPGGWSGFVERGHEIGNHSLRHPCTGNVRWARRAALEQFTLAGIEADIDAANREIEDLFGVTPRVFAYPCGQTFVGRGAATQSYVPLIARLFLVGRSFREAWANAPLYCDLSQVATISSDEMSFAGLRPLLDEALAQGSWIVLGGHEIGDGGRETTHPDTIRDIVSWCRSEGVRMGTVGAIAETVAAIQQQASGQESSGSMTPLPSIKR